MSYRKAIIAAILISILTALLAASCLGAALPYSSSRRQINVGIIRLTAPGINGTRDNRYNVLSPYIFLVMDYRSDIKPRGWELVNPLAPQGYTKEQWQYWMVDLTSVSIENLSRFDVLYFCTDNNKGTIELTTDEQDKLRRYVDAGGLLWIDNGGGMNFDADKGLFIHGFNFVDAGGTPWIPYEQLSHPLVSVPNKLSSMEITRVGRLYPIRYGVNPGYNMTNPFDMKTYNPTVLLSIAVLGPSAGLPYIAGNEYGSGHVVATAGWIGGNISDAITGIPTPDYITPQNSNMLMASPASLKLAYNIVYWAGSYTGFRKNARHTACSLENLNPALVEKWHFPFPPSTDTECAPAVFKNCFFYVGIKDGQATLFALDGAPEQDWDGDGNPNDGAQDEPAGANYDIIWAAPLGGPGASSPTVFSMQDPRDTKRTIDVVAVVETGGYLLLFEALPMTGGVLSPSPVMIGGPQHVGTAAAGGKIYAPTYHNGWLYIAGGDGRVHALNPFLAILGVSDFTWLYQIQDPTLPTGGMKSSPVVGMIKNKERGANVTMVYTLAPPLNMATSGEGTSISSNDRLFGFPVFVSGDRLQLIGGAGTSNPSYSTLYGATNNGTKIEENYPKPKIWAESPDGTPLYEGDLNDPEVNQPYFGQMRITRKSGGVIDPNARIYATYALCYEPIGVNFFNPRVAVPLPPAELSTISAGNPPLVRGMSSLAFGANGMIYAGVYRETSNSLYPACGSVYALLNDNVNNAKLKWAYHLHGGDPAGTYVSPDYMSPDYVIPDRGNGKPMFKPSAYDIIKEGSLDIKREIYGLKCNSSPAVTPDKVFVTATSDTASGTARGALFCFKANPDFVIRLNQSLIDNTTGAKARVKIWQPDPAISPSPRSPLEDAVAVPPEMIDYNTGTISIQDFAHGSLRTRSGSGINASTNVFTPALPVWVFVNEELVPPQQVDLSSWNNLLWFYVPKHGTEHCSGIHGSPVVMGDQVYFTCDDGYMFALDIENGVRNGEALTDSKHIKWASKVTTGGTSVLASSVGGANRLLGVVGGDGFHVFENPTTLIADSKRVLQVDGSSNIIWACDSTSEILDSPAKGGNDMLRRKQPLNRPALARNFGPSDFLVVDAGNNQVIRMDKGGFISDKVSRFYVPAEHEGSRYINGNWQSNYTLLLSGESDSLRGPVDALLWVNQEKWKNPNTQTVETINVAHWLIADAGNFRIVDIVQRFNQNGPLYSPGNKERLPELNWVTRTDVSQKTFAFNSLQLVPLSLTKEEIWAAVGNYASTSGQVGGSIVRIPYRGRPSATDPFLLEYTTGHDAKTIVNAIGGVPLANPKYVRRITGDVNHLLICDDRGVFEVAEPPADSTNATTIAWGVVNSGGGGNIVSYSSLDREVWNKTGNKPVTRKVDVPLRAMKAQKLPNGNVLITNSYSGIATYDRSKFPNGPDCSFTGEVFEVNLKGSLPVIEWYAPRIEEEGQVDETVDMPTSMMQKFEQGSPLVQPMSAERILW